MAKTVLALLLSFALAAPSFGVTLQEAARQAAKQNNAKVLSARTIQQGTRRQYEIKLLTDKGVVKTIRRPAPAPKKPKPKQGDDKRG